MLDEESMRGRSLPTPEGTRDVSTVSDVQSVLSLDVVLFIDKAREIIKSEQRDETSRTLSEIWKKLNTGQNLCQRWIYFHLTQGEQDYFIRKIANYLVKLLVKETVADDTSGVSIEIPI